MRDPIPRIQDIPAQLITARLQFIKDVLHDRSGFHLLATLVDITATQGDQSLNILEYERLWSSGTKNSHELPIQLPPIITQRPLLPSLAERLAGKSPAQYVHRGHGVPLWTQVQYVGLQERTIGVVAVQREIPPVHRAGERIFLVRVHALSPDGVETKSKAADAREELGVRERRGLVLLSGGHVVVVSRQRLGQDEISDQSAP